jgi:Mrp family chromosome partitioning ATPase
MTALDRAIIKKLSQTPGNGPSRPRNPAVPGDSDSGVPVLRGAASQPTTTARPLPTAVRATASPVVPLSQALPGLAVTASPAKETAPVPSKKSDFAPIAPAFVTDESSVPNSGLAPVGPSIAALLDEALQPEFPQSSSADVDEPAPLVAVETESAAAVTETIVVEADMDNARAAAVDEIPLADTTTVAADIRPQSPPEPADTPYPATGVETWRPLLQVDRVVWPSISSRLQTTAATAVEQMAKGLLAICRPGHNVLGLAGCNNGEGVTTLLLAAARTLLNQGRKVALVDGNWRNPQLAKCLGLLPQIGWEETLCGGLPLEEVVIESLADGLAVLPVRQPSASETTPEQITATFDILRRQFDVVLVDLGSLDQVKDEDSASHDVAARIDAVVLVQNVRVTPPNRLAEVREHLAASNLPYAGTIQNFVAG